MELLGTGGLGCGCVILVVVVSLAGVRWWSGVGGVVPSIGLVTSQLSLPAPTWPSVLWIPLVRWLPPGSVPSMGRRGDVGNSSGWFSPGGTS